MLLDFFKADTAGKGWFLANSGSSETTPPVAEEELRKAGIVRAAD